MKPFDKALRQTVFELVQGGVQGQMADGDTYGLWLVSNQVDTSFAMETWFQRFRVELGAKAATHLKKHGYKAKARLDLAFADAIRIAKHVGDLNIILVSNGETPIVGTPFDEAVNGRFRQLAPEMKRAKATLNTTFVARDGQIVAWAANQPDFLIAMPLVPPKPKPTLTEAPTSATTNATNATLPMSSPNSIPKAIVHGQVAQTNAEPPRPRIAIKPIIITKETVAEEKRTYQALTMIGTSNESAHTALGTNPVTEQIKLQSTNIAAASITNVIEAKPVAAVTNRIQPPQVANVPADVLATNLLTASKSESTNFEATAASITRVAPAEPPSAESRQIHPFLWAVIGGGTASVAMLAILFIHRCRRQEPSLISQTIRLERVHSTKI